MADFNHLDARGRARMVDVGEKPVTARRAVASAFVAMAPETLARLNEGRLAKGDALLVAKLAGIQGAKRTSDLIPLCHPLPLDQVTVDLEPDPDRAGVTIRTEARTQARTGVEMEALTAASVAGLALIDMVKSADRSAHLRSVHLELKEGGKSGRWVREAGEGEAP